MPCRRAFWCITQTVEKEKSVPPLGLVRDLKKKQRNKIQENQHNNTISVKCLRMSERTPLHHGVQWEKKENKSQPLGPKRKGTVEYTYIHTHHQTGDCILYRPNHLRNRLLYRPISTSRLYILYNVFGLLFVQKKGGGGVLCAIVKGKKNK